MFSPSFSIHLENSPYKATVVPMKSVDACALRIGEPDTFLPSLALFFPFDKLEQVQRIADALNEISPSPAASNPLAA